MGTRDARVDAYIAKSAPFARPILKLLRSVVHEACPEAEETLKWGAPFFMYQGILAGLAAFKQHCAFILWKGSLVVNQEGRRVDEAMGHLGRITSIEDLPPKKVLIGYVKQAMKLNESGAKAPPKKSKPKTAPVVPPALSAALKKNKKAAAQFKAFSTSHRREYCDWIADAKAEDTRARRVKTAVEWIAEGKGRNWKYQGG